MEASRFDLLLRKAAQETTRRGAFGALIGGALLIGLPDAGETTDKAKRRRKRNRKQRRRQTHKNALAAYPVDIRVDNTQGRNWVKVVHGGSNSRPGTCCRLTENPPTGITFTVRNGWSYMFRNQDAGQTTSWVLINDKYWFQFTDPDFREPYAQIAINGRFAQNSPSEGANCCTQYPNGATVERRWGFDRRETRFYNIENTALFRVHRQDDESGHRVFLITLPPTL